MSGTKQVKRDRVGEYVLGLSSREERDGVARAADRDRALAGEIATLNEALVPLLGAEEIAPPPHLFDRIKAALPRRSQLLPDTVTVRAGDGQWEPLVEGIVRKMLWHDRASARITFLVKAEPGSRFPSHVHDDDEACYVLSGDLVFDTLVLGAGDFHLARPGMSHPIGVTKTGCMLLVTAAA